MVNNVYHNAMNIIKLWIVLNYVFHQAILHVHKMVNTYYKVKL